MTITEMRRALRDFTDKTRDADIAVVFYAGHGIEVDGTNYLLPVDTALERDTDVEDEALALDRIVKIMEPVRRLRLVILDACRDNPFTRTMKRTLSSRSVGRGLGKVEVQTSDTLIAFAAKAGSTASDGEGKNSPFTTALLNNLATPGLDLRLAFGRVRDEVLRSTGSKQEPFVYGSLGGTTVSLVPAVAEPVVAAPAPTPAPAINMQAEMRRDYELAGQIGTKEAWDQFLSVYSTGLYAGLARAARAKLVAEEAKAEAEAKAAAARSDASSKAAAAKAETEAKAAAKAAADAKIAAAKAEADAKAAAAKQAPMVVASATPAAAVETPTPGIDSSDTARKMQTELRGLGCYPGAVNGDWKAIPAERLASNSTSTPGCGSTSRSRASMRSTSSAARQRASVRLSATEVTRRRARRASRSPARPANSSATTQLPLAREAEDGLAAGAEPAGIRCQTGTQAKRRRPGRLRPWPSSRTSRCATGRSR